MNLTFSSKAKTLKSLEGIIKHAEIPQIYLFTYEDWNLNKENLLLKIFSKIKSNTFIVRSSSSQEDKKNASKAGAFLSVPFVKKEDLKYSIDKVFKSYGEINSEDEVFVQPMLDDVLLSGVGFSHDPNTLSPYRIINWNEGPDTSVVTGGLGGKLWQQAAHYKGEVKKEVKPIIILIEELLNLFGQNPIDIEFAVTKKNQENTLWLLQVRPLIISGEIESEKSQSNRLKNIESKISEGIKPHPFLIGQRTVYGVMPDWNPAEIVGIRPRPLAFSLYRELITDSIWAYQRHNYGYRNLRSFPLMKHFYGLPYVDVRLSFNSFIPADLDDQLAGRVVDYYINKLLKEPTLHDKVEFDIVFSCYTFDLPERLKNLSDFGFSKTDQMQIAVSLRNLTNKILHPKTGLWKKDAAKLDILKMRREKLLNSSSSNLEKIYWLIEDAKRYGTLPFAGLARAGFISIQMLRSLVNIKVLSENDYDSFLSSISTISSDLSRDKSTLNRSSFLSKYGHLRPGTYDILSPRYDEAPDYYFDWEINSGKEFTNQIFSCSLDQMREIASLLKIHDLESDPFGIFDFMQFGIELRELAKFQFSKNLSDVLSLITDLGNNLGFSKEELSYLDYSVFQELQVGASDPKDILGKSIERGKLRYSETQRTSLPPLITSPEDVWAFEWPSTEPNFITQKRVSGEIRKNIEKERLNGKIVCIPNADPGYDWLFSYPIAGLVTAWGGANSHMAIRAGEMSLPSVIGVGEILFKKISNSNKIILDCACRKIVILE